jgi:hypothetical protein
LKRRLENLEEHRGKVATARPAADSFPWNAPGFFLNTYLAAGARGSPYLLRKQAWGHPAPEATRGPEAASESAGRGDAPPESREWSLGHEGETYGTPAQEAENSLHPRKRSWWREFFGLK